MDGADKMIPEYRGETKNGKVVFGWLNYDAVEKCYFIMENCWFRGRENITLTTGLFYEITQSTLARYTGQKDKHEICIYGSFELNGKMTEGGDVVRSDVFDFNGSYLHETMDYNVVFEGGMWIMKSIDTNYDNNILHSIGSGLLEIIKEK